jgi:predicted  nucleic acid-binding Zn-ribbon protein
MRKIMDHLFALQKLEFAARARTPAPPVEVEKLRAEVPAPILAHYDRLTARGKKGVALARNGVCSECHLRITGAKLVWLTAGSDVQLCDNCGRYLCLPIEPPVELVAPKPPAAAVKRTRREVATHAA